MDENKPLAAVFVGNTRVTATMSEKDAQHLAEQMNAGVTLRESKGSKVATVKQSLQD